MIPVAHEVEQYVEGPRLEADLLATPSQCVPGLVELALPKAVNVRHPASVSHGGRRPHRPQCEALLARSTCCRSKAPVRSGRASWESSAGAGLADVDRLARQREQLAHGRLEDFERQCVVPGIEGRSPSKGPPWLMTTETFRSDHAPIKTG